MPAATTQLAIVARKTPLRCGSQTKQRKVLSCSLFTFLPLFLGAVPPCGTGLPLVGLSPTVGSAVPKRVLIDGALASCGSNPARMIFSGGTVSLSSLALEVAKFVKCYVAFGLATKGRLALNTPLQLLEQK